MASKRQGDDFPVHFPWQHAHQSPEARTLLFWLEERKLSGFCPGEMRLSPMWCFTLLSGVCCLHRKSIRFNGFGLTRLSWNTANVTYCIDDSVWDKSYSEELVWWCQFSKSTKWTPKAAGIYLSENDVSLMIFIYYLPHWSIFIFLCSKEVQ